MQEQGPKISNSESAEAQDYYFRENRNPRLLSRDVQEPRITTSGSTGT